MNWTISQTTLLAILLGSVRAGAWLMLCPPFNTGGIPTPVKALLSVSIVLPIAPQLAKGMPANPSTGTLITMIVEQAMIGAALGFLTAIFFAAVQAAGALIDMFGGFSVAFAFDPLTKSGTSVLARFYNLTAMALLFATDAHQMVLRGFMRSFTAVPLDGTLSLNRLSQSLTTAVTHMFVAALQIAAPLLAVLFVADIALGLLSRVAPALNVLGLSFPAKILLTMSIVGSGIALLPGSVSALVDKAVAAGLKLVGAS